MRAPSRALSHEACSLPPVKALSVLALAAFIVACAGPLVEDCTHGDLDQRYCDSDGDLVADPSMDPSTRLDPERLIFAYTPVEDPAQFRGVWAGFLQHLEKDLYKKYYLTIHGIEEFFLLLYSSLNPLL